MGWCDHCQNTGWLDCYCGGDLCVCENQGEYPGPHCVGMTDDDDEVLTPEEEARLQRWLDAQRRKRAKPEENG